VSPNCAHAKLGVLDAVKITAFTGDWRILQAFAAEVGALVVPIHSNAGGEADTLAVLGQMAKEFAELVSATGETMADGLVSDNELARLERETGDLVQAAQRVLEQRAEDPIAFAAAAGLAAVQPLDLNDPQAFTAELRARVGVAATISCIFSNSFTSVALMPDWKTAGTLR
jgi:hypothetical protein